MTIKTEISLSDFRFWSGAIHTQKYLVEKGGFEALDRVEDVLESLEDYLTETEVNDLFWFQPDTICEWAGLPPIPDNWSPESEDD